MTAQTHLASVTQVADKSFDYVIIGGGTTGLCLASRLSEDPQVTVLVLEVGELRLNDPLIDTPAGFPLQIGNPKYDWAFKTAPQKHVNDNTYIWNRGKGLGGSSNINYLAWTRPSREDINAWERLGNPGWNWENFLPYLKKSENFHYPSEETIAREQLDFDPQWFGQEGHVSISFPTVSSGVETTVRETLKRRGLPILQDAVNGNTTGTWCATSSVDPRTLTRSSSTSAYFLPNSRRDNLQVLTGAQVNHLVLEDSKEAELVSATGVEFRHGNYTHRVRANQEVILCAGALKSPQLLELSGIGNSEILRPLGIDTKLHLPGVGENVQEHVSNLSVTFELREDAKVQTFDILSDPVEKERHHKLYLESRRGLMALTVTGLSFLPVQTFSSRARAIVDAQLEKISKGRNGYAPGLFDQYQIQAEHLNNPKLHECEMITTPMFGGAHDKAEPGKRYISFHLALISPWSRGSLHVASKDSAAQPEIDPHYLEEDIDLELLVEEFKFARSMGDYEPFKSLIVKEANPGPAVANDTEIRDLIKQGLSSIWHTTGSLSMLPREKRGVVDPSLLVWGTKNIRVADLSIVPLQIGVHTQATAYAIAERVADIIRGRA